MPGLPVPEKRLLLLCATLVAVSLAFMTIGARGNWGFVLGFRGTKLAALLVVGAAVGTATVIFQTIAGNRILTPGVMGFDALFVLLQTTLVFFLSGLGLASLGQETRFTIEFLLLMGAALILFGTLFASRRTDIQRLVLTGIILGVLFRSLAGFMQRLIDPNEFAFVQTGTIARFNAIDGNLLGITAAMTGGAIAVAWMRRHRLDVLSLGRDHAVNLGLDHRREVVILLIVVAALVSVSTALAGPVVFFGLLVAALAHALMRSHRHAILMPAAALIAGIVLVGGQTVIERVMGLSTPLSVIVEFAGGLTFLVLVLREAHR